MIRAERQPDGSVTAVSEIVVGIETRSISVPLGLLDGAVDPGGMRGSPVVVVDPAYRSLVRRGAERSGDARIVELPDGAAPLGARLLDSADVADVVIVATPVAESCEPMLVTRALGGRPIVALPLDEPDAARRMLEDVWIDLDIVIPSVDGALRDEVRSRAEALGLFRAHHVVEADPRPAFDGVVAGATLTAMTAAAAGVLAGRLAAGNRRWR